MAMDGHQVGNWCNYAAPFSFEGRRKGGAIEKTIALHTDRQTDRYNDTTKVRKNRRTKVLKADGQTDLSPILPQGQKCGRFYRSRPATKWTSTRSTSSFTFMDS